MSLYDRDPGDCNDFFGRFDCEDDGDDAYDTAVDLEMERRAEAKMAARLCVSCERQRSTDGVLCLGCAPTVSK